MHGGLCSRKARQQSGKVVTGVGIVRPLPRHPIEDGRGPLGLAACCDRKAKQQQRLHIHCIFGKKAATCLLGLLPLAGLKPSKCQP